MSKCWQNFHYLGKLSLSLFIYILLLDLIMVMWSQYSGQHIVLTYNICSKTPKCPNIVVMSFACCKHYLYFNVENNKSGWILFFLQTICSKQMFLLLVSTPLSWAHRMLFLFEKLLVITYFQTQKGNLLCISSILSLISGQQVWEVWLRCDGDPGGRYSPRHSGLTKLR